MLAFASIVVAGTCGGLIAYAVTDLQCAGSAGTSGDDSCTVLAGGAGLIGAVACALGVAMVAVLVLRAMAEWRKQIPEVQRPSRTRRNPSA